MREGRNISGAQEDCIKSIDTMSRQIIDAYMEAEVLFPCIRPGWWVVLEMESLVPEDFGVRSTFVVDTFSNRVQEVSISSIIQLLGAGDIVQWVRCCRQLTLVRSLASRMVP